MFPVLPGFPVSYPPLPMYRVQLPATFLNSLSGGQTRAQGAISQTEAPGEIDLPSNYITADTIQQLSKFSSKLGSNYVPTDQEVHYLKELLSEPCANLQALDTNIALAQALLSKNIKDRALLAAQLEKYQSLVSSIRRVPPDVLSEIFFHCLPADTYKGSMSVAVAPMLLTRVCSAWRTVALLTPQLWSTIQIIVHHPIRQYSGLTLMPANQGATNDANNIHQWLSRSGSLALDISIAYSSSSPAFDTDERQDSSILNGIVTFSMRWRSLILSGPPKVQKLLKRLRLRPEHVPNLEKLSIAIENASFLHYPNPALLSPAPFPSLPFMFKAPKLAWVSLKVQRNPATLSLNWAQLTTLKLYHGEEPEIAGLRASFQIFDVLKRCLYLVSFYVSFSSEMLATDIDELDALQLSLGQVTLSFLQSLSITGRAYICAFLPTLDVPVLKNFAFTSETLESFTVNPQAFTSETFIPVLRLCFSITSLCFTNPLTFTSGVPEAPTLRHMQNGENVVDDELMQMFSPEEMDGDDGPLCPLLEHFSCKSQTSFTEEGLLSLIRRKQDNNNHDAVGFKAVEVMLPDYMMGGYLKGYTSTNVNGATLNVTYYPAPVPMGTYPMYFPPVIMQRL